MDIKDIENIIKILKQNEVTEFELEQEGTRVKLRLCSFLPRLRLFLVAPHLRMTWAVT
jgi:hypothetical protein